MSIGVALSAMVIKRSIKTSGETRRKAAKNRVFGALFQCFSA
jgi:hypothetical protein